MIGLPPSEVGGDHLSVRRGVARAWPATSIGGPGGGAGCGVMTDEAVGSGPGPGGVDRGDAERVSDAVRQARRP